MNNKGNQPIYDNKNLTNAGKYDFDMVNAINKRSGEMKFDSTLPIEKEKEPNKYKSIILTSVISFCFIVFALIFSFTDLKYVVFARKEEKKEVNSDFEAADVMHTMECVLNAKKQELNVFISKKYIYNNNKVKKTIYEYIIDVTKEEIANDSSYHNYMKNNFNFLIDAYGDIDGIKMEYNKDQSAYHYIQEMDLEKISTNADYLNLTDIYYNQNIDVTKSKIQREGLKCTKE